MYVVEITEMHQICLPHSIMISSSTLARLVFVVRTHTQLPSLRITHTFHATMPPLRRSSSPPSATSPVSECFRRHKTVSALCRVRPADARRSSTASSSSKRSRSRCDAAAAVEAPAAVYSLCCLCCCHSPGHGFPCISPR